MVSRGKLITGAPVWSGEMCSSIDVSERDPWMSVPNLPLVPARESEPMIRMFVEPFSFGGRVAELAAVMVSWLMLS